MKNVMKKAWEIARKGAKKFGGSVKSYFAKSLKMAWVIVKTETGAVNANVLEMAKTFAKKEYELHNQTTPSLKDAKYGKKVKNVEQFEIDLQTYVNEIKKNEELYKTGCETFGEETFFNAVENERFEIGRKVFGFNQ